MSQQFDDESTDSFSSGIRVPKGSIIKPDSFRPVLICTNGPQRGRRFKLEQLETVLGRSREADFLIDDHGASRKHIKIIYENFQNPKEQPQCFLEDLQSRNGTELNGKAVKTRMKLEERDRIMIGRTTVGYFYRDEGELMQDESLYENATRDPLTGLDNRRHFLSLVKHYFAKSSRRQIEFSLLLADVDRFKSINDTYGHQVGDEALRHLSRVIIAVCRDSDLIARWGGEEIAIGLPDTVAKDALLLAERLRVNVERSPLATGETKVPMTISIGVTSLQENDNLDDLFARADKHLYEAKKAGRNRVIATP